MERRSQEREATVGGRLRLILEYYCPECSEKVEAEVRSYKHWIFDVPAQSEVCPHCHAGLEILRPDPEAMPDVLAPFASVLTDEPEDDEPG